LFPNWKKDLPKRNKISKLKLKRRANFVGMKFGGGGKRGRAKIPSPQPPSFLPARASGERSEPIIQDFAQNEF
jgi:hypothetical protein